MAGKEAKTQRRLQAASEAQAVNEAHVVNEAHAVNEALAASETRLTYPTFSLNQFQSAGQISSVNKTQAAQQTQPDTQNRSAYEAPSGNQTNQPPSSYQIPSVNKPQSGYHNASMNRTPLVRQAASTYQTPSAKQIESAYETPTFSIKCMGSLEMMHKLPCKDTDVCQWTAHTMACIGFKCVYLIIPFIFPSTQFTGDSEWPNRLGRCLPHVDGTIAMKLKDIDVCLLQELTLADFARFLKAKTERSALRIASSTSSGLQRRMSDIADRMVWKDHTWFARVC